MKELQRFLELDNIIKFLKTNLFKLLIIFLIIKIGKIFKTRIEKILKIIMEKSNVDRSLASFLLSIYSILYYFIIVYSSIGILGINTSSITTFLGAAGIIFGIAFKETLGNFCGGLIILTFKPFRVGDTIEYNNYIGTVKKIELFYTKMLNPQNELVIIPNGIVTNTEIRNIKQDGERRLDLEIGVSYKSDIQKVKKVLERIVKEETMDEIEETKIKNNFNESVQNSTISKKDRNKKMILASKASVIGVGKLAESAIIFYIYVYTRSENYLNLKLKLNEKIKTEFDKAGIEIPYPQMDVHIKEFENKI